MSSTIAATAGSAGSPAIERVRKMRSAAWGPSAAALLAIAGAALTLRIWRADLGVPFRYSLADDTKFYISLVKGILDHGWFLSNPSLGAPFGQHLYDFPQGADNLSFLLIKGLGVLWPNPAIVVNLFFLLTFPLTALAAYVVLRRLEVSEASAAVCGALFALLPYHFFRSDSHLMLSAYYAVPLGAYLFLRIARGEALFERRAGRGSGLASWASRRTGWTLLACAVIGSTGLYYAVFAFALALAASFVAMISQRGRGAVASGLVSCCLIAGVVALNISPTIENQFRHGGNPVLSRPASEGDDLGLSLSYLILPPLHDRIAPLRGVTARYARSTPPHGYCEQCYESLGSVGTIGFGWLVLFAIGACVGAPWVGRRARVYPAAAVGVGVCIVLGATGGLSSLLRVFVGNDIRAWNRLSLPIAFFSLLAAGLLLDAAGRRLRTRPRGGLLFGALLALVALLGVYEQTGSYFVPPYRRDAREYRSDAQFVAGIERLLPSGSSVFNLPYVPFPEGYQPYLAPDQTVPYSQTVNFEYEQDRGYIHSTSLRWSYGAMKGRAVDWDAQLAAKPLDLGLAGAAAAGFRAVVIDRRGYPGALRPALGRELRELLGAPPTASPDGQLLFSDLRAYARLLRAQHTAAQLAALSSAVLDPLRLSCSPGRLTIVNPDRALRTAMLVAGVSGSGSGTIREPLRLPAGTTTIPVRSLASPGATLLAPTVIDSAFAPFARSGGAGIRAGILGPPCARVAVGR